MASVGLVNPAVELALPPVHGEAELQLRVEDALASARRLWVRGRLGGGPLRRMHSSSRQRWWRGWWAKSGASQLLGSVRLETRISGHVFESDVPLTPEGRFEAMFSANLPVARRGWRIARNRVTWQERTVEQCGVVVQPSDDVCRVAVVILPLDFTSQAQGAQRLARSKQAARLAPVLRWLQNGAADAHAIYYLAGVSPHADSRQAELALAVTTLGWPAGTFVCLPAAADAPDRMAIGLDRLRWLFADAMDLLIFNLEPGFTEALAASTGPKEDRANLQRLLNPDDDPGVLLADALPKTVEESISAIRPVRASLVPRYPVVFCHGMLAMTTLRMQLPEDLNCFSPLRQFLRERGFRALFPQVAPTSGIVTRAQQLREQILRWTDGPINIIAHSMGGLDARYLITHMGMADRVRSLTTVASPHRGTYLVDWFLTNFRSRVPLLLAMEAMGVNVDGFRDCRPSACVAFNASTPDMPGVRYFSYAGAVPAGRVTPVLRRAWSILNAAEGPNDGMVSLESARWGEYLGLLNADHFAQTPDRVFVRPGEDFDALAFYSRLIEDLARRGF